MIVKQSKKACFDKIMSIMIIETAQTALLSYPSFSDSLETPRIHRIPDSSNACF